MGLIRQGDVLLVPTTDLPAETKRVKRVKGRLVLAYGEATGHHHSIVEEHAELVTAADATDLFLRVYGDDVALVHQEHSTLTIAPGDYRVVRQREYTPAAPVWVTD